MAGVRLDNPPPAPPDVQSQMGAMLQQKFAQGGQPGQDGAPPPDLKSASETNPRGALMVKINAIEKVAKEIAQQHEAMAPFVERAMNTLKQGMQEVLSQGNQQSTSEPQQGAAGVQPYSGGGQKPLEGHSDSGFVG